MYSGQSTAQSVHEMTVDSHPKRWMSWLSESCRQRVIEETSLLYAPCAQCCLCFAHENCMPVSLQARNERLHDAGLGEEEKKDDDDDDAPDKLIEERTIQSAQAARNACTPRQGLQCTQHLPTKAWLVHRHIQSPSTKTKKAQLRRPVGALKAA